MTKTQSRSRGAWTIIMASLGLFLLIQGLNTAITGAQATYFSLALIDFILAASVWSGKPRLNPAVRTALLVTLAALGVVALILWLFFFGSGAAR